MYTGLETERLTKEKKKMWLPTGNEKTTGISTKNNSNKQINKTSIVIISHTPTHNTHTQHTQLHTLDVT